MNIEVMPGGLPFIGHGAAILRAPLDFFVSVRERGDVVRIKLGPQSAYVISEPVLINRVLTQDSRYFEKGVQFDKARVFMGNGLLTSTEPVHMRNRRMLQPAFHRQQTAKYLDIMRDAAQHEMSGWSDGAVVHLDKVVHSFTVNVVCRALFSAERTTAIAEQVTAFLPVLLAGLSRRIAVPSAFLEKLPTTGNRRFKEAQAVLASIVEEVTDENRDRESSDLMSLLRAARDDEGNGLCRQQLHDEATAIFLGGVETSANALSWTCHLLSTHPDLQKRLANEVAQVLGDRPVRASDLPTLGSVRRVVTETLRLYPPTWLMSRRALSDVTIGGHHIPAGSNVLLSVYAIHRNPAVYLDPDEFEPDRWLDEQRDKTRRMSFIPFGGGNRSCIGEAFAWNEMIVFLAILLRRWRLAPLPGSVVQPVVAATLQPNQLPVRLALRSAVVATDTATITTMR